MEQGKVGEFASGGKIFLQEFPAILASLEILMATPHLLAKRPSLKASLCHVSS